MTDKQCMCNFRDEISFKSFDDFESHQSFVQQNKNFIEVSFSTYGGFVETWYKCNQCFKTWRLIQPDSPFRGDWSVVPKSEL